MVQVGQLIPAPHGGRWRVADVFSGAGGAGEGYARLGCEVTGFDIAPQPRFPYEFVQADALSVDLSGFDLVHWSAPCQAHSKAWRIRANDHPDLIAAFRQRCLDAGVPYVAENVPGAPLIAPEGGSLIELCGTMLGLALRRHRLFETSLPVPQPPHPPHVAPQAKMGRALRPGEIVQVVGNFSDVKAARRAMGIEWMTRDELREAIPPAFTAYAGAFMLAAIAEQAGERRTA
jgi:DNA (cytosine-5)-methyltransferase 1